MWLRHLLGGHVPLLLFVPSSLALHHLLVQKRLDTDSASLRAEMATKGIGASKSSATTPLTTHFQIPFTYELLFT